VISLERILVEQPVVWRYLVTVIPSKAEEFVSIHSLRAATPFWIFDLPEIPVK